MSTGVDVTEVRVTQSVGTGVRHYMKVEKNFPCCRGREECFLLRFFMEAFFC